MKTKHQLGGLVAVSTAFVVGLAGYGVQHGMAVLVTKGPVGDQERNLLVAATLLMLLVVIPVFVLTFHIGHKYRASNTSATYRPDDDHNLKLEALWWGFPMAVILVLAIITWNSSHTLDPFRPLSATTAAMPVQVVALQYKWLFLYPSQHVASVNELHVPVNTPISFQITSDAPMNSFWIPRLGGQVYAMPGMSTALHLEASKIGTYRGSSANISGSGFADMHFAVYAEDDGDFNNWVRETAGKPATLTAADYKQLSQPGTLGVRTYANYDVSLFPSILGKYSMTTKPTDSQPGFQSAATEPAEQTNVQPTGTMEMHHE